MKLSTIFSASFLAALAVAAPAPARAGQANLPEKREGGEGQCPPGTVWEYPNGDDEVGGCVVDHSTGSAEKRDLPEDGECPEGQHLELDENDVGYCAKDTTPEEGQEQSVCPPGSEWVGEGEQGRCSEVQEETEHAKRQQEEEK
ncbi:hypothetical protein P170DRAFT_505510 [Aspergillus steynii IBT 23096]|uniref:Uncharacterized protein n=1 Tax=Aspergillus steynii IBT 23096 TaxID=1392250 RepID=A0A2I2GPM4_9EURO|nr:uncharacterized protein P170DRAFT_505510 [Aspergillus steynii IBT 23096]PLB54828.1 hypothetical protein P170DRAFT_505510 [Aspergillus steynii IBT 23096]